MRIEITPVALPRTFHEPALQLLGLDVVGKIEGRLGELHAGYQWTASRQLQRHLREYILPGLAAYQALRAEGQPQETALAGVNELRLLSCARQKGTMGDIARQPKGGAPERNVQRQMDEFSEAAAERVDC